MTPLLMMQSNEQRMQVLFGPDQVPVKVVKREVCGAGM